MKEHVNALHEKRALQMGHENIAGQQIGCISPRETCHDTQFAGDYANVV